MHVTAEKETLSHTRWKVRTNTQASSHLYTHVVWHVYTCIHTQTHIYTIPTIPVHGEILPTGRTLEWVEADLGQPFPVEKEVVCSENMWALGH